MDFDPSANNISDFAMDSKPAVILAVQDGYQDVSFAAVVASSWRAMVELAADPRAKELPLMADPLPTCGLIICYLLWVLLIGPMYMRDRKPMDLRRVIIFYNLFQVLLSGYMFYEHLMAGWLRGYSFSCQTVDYDDGPLSRRMFNLCYVYYLSKLTEFADTVFFVLRKKQSQITDLHVYHHSLTPMEAWILTKFIAGGNATFPNIINNFVHVLMYFYYMLSAMGPRYQKYLWWKKYMTEVQIIQFILCIGHCINALVTGCPFPRFISTLLLINASIFLALFMNFYIQSYKRRPKAVVAGSTVEKVEEPVQEAPMEVKEVNNNTVESVELLEKQEKSDDVPVEELKHAEEVSEETCEESVVEELVEPALPKDVTEAVEGLRQRIVTLDELIPEDRPSRVEEVTK